MMSWLRDEWDRVRGRARYDFEFEAALEDGSPLLNDLNLKPGSLGTARSPHAVTNVRTALSLMLALVDEKDAWYRNLSTL